ncbi:MAG TPA: protein translocase subunit SecD [Pirellulaceae bacterium]|nr:protein translocase subunit SecD [Pirellulaceae bacterium]
MNVFHWLQSLSPILAENRYRLIDFDWPPILPDSLNVASFPAVLLGLIVVSFVLGWLFERATRLKDYGWKVGLILATTLVSTFVVLFGNFRLGPDLSGGIILVYEVDKRATAEMSRKGKSDWEMGQLLTVIRRRLNPDGLKEIVVRPFGQQQVEIVVPETDPLEVQKIKELINTAGVLQFMIVAGETNDDNDLVELAKTHAERPDQERLKREVLNENGERVGFWATLAREDPKPGETDPPFRGLELIQTAILRGTGNGQILDLTQQERNTYAFNEPLFKAYLAQHGLRDVDVLLKFDADFDVRGDDLSSSAASIDHETFSPCIHFTMTTGGSNKMGFLTQNNLQRKLAIVFDSKLLSAPVIRSKIDTNGQITGRFTQEEVDFIVGILKSGSMPVVMQKQPTSENQIGAILGRDTIEQGSWSVVVALGLILLFMVLYYRVSGAIASFALALNLLLTVAIMVLLQAPFTLPGLAGLVLTVAMSVDANVLISERMREELAKGATLRMAIRNGFDKALSAIIDGNLTTFFTALVLYAIGTDQVRGFGITLMLGNVTSMFTAIFCARVLLDIGERTRWLKTLRMASFLTNPQIDWVKFFAPAAVASVILIVVGIVATVARGRGLFDIDLAGGTSATFILKEPTPETEIRQRLEAAFKGMIDEATNTRVDHNVYQFKVNTERDQTVYKVDSSLESVDKLKETIRNALRAKDGSDLLKTYNMELSTVTEVSTEKPPPSISAPPAIGAPPAGGPALTPPAGAPPAEAPQTGTPAEAPPAKAPAATPDEKSKKTSEPAPGKSPETTEPKKTEEDAKAKDSSECDPAQEAKSAEPAKTDQEKAEPAKTETKADQEKTDAAKTEPPKAAEAPPAAAGATKAADAAKAGEPPPAATSPAGTPLATEPPLPGTPVEAPLKPLPKTKVTAHLKFPGTPLSGFALHDRIVASGRAAIGREVNVLVKNPQWDSHDNSTFSEWDVEITGVTQEQGEKILQNMKETLRKEVIWQTSNKIGGQVSADTRWRALGALAVSLLIIVAYVWFRFQRVAWGLAAVAALAHDALVMLTCIALSYWCASALGFLGVEEFKISLSVVAAFLAILGYSVNDTIVIFDRLREIRGKSPDVTRQMLNDAVNQTLSRNIILAGITVTVVVILYVFGGPGIHAFAFALMTGVISGCYTTLVIAAPLLLWLLNRGAVQSTGKKVEKREGVAA